MAYRSPGKRLLFALIAVVIFFAAAEGIFRLLGLNIQSGGTGRVDRLLYFDVSREQVGVDVNLVLGVKVHLLESGAYNTKPPITPKQPGTLRILCLGDSSTIGDGVRPDQAYCPQLATELEQRLGRKVEDFNLGFFGYSSYQGRMLYDRYAKRIEPDAVVFYFGANDAVHAPLREDKDWDKVPMWMLQSNGWMYAHSALYRFLRNINARYLLQMFVHPFNREARQTPFRSRVTKTDFLANLRHIRSDEQQHGGRVYVVPYLALRGAEMNLEGLHYHEDMDDPRMIDLRPAFSAVLAQGRSPFVDGIHPSPEGHKIIADLLADKIVADFDATAKPSNPSEN